MSQIHTQMGVGQMEREKCKPDSVSGQLEMLLNQQIEYAEKTKLRVFECLERVSFPSEPTCDKLAADEEQWPSFFANMRSGLYQISETLDAINRAAWLEGEGKC